jgi:hypothetical protein
MAEDPYYIPFKAGLKVRISIQKLKLYERFEILRI